MRRKNWLALFGFVILSEGAGIIGSVFTFSSIPSWYVFLARPSFAPPNVVFGPVWTTLYLLMGIAAFLVWRKGIGRSEVKQALAVFMLQLALNAFWSILFFGLHSLLGAVIEIVFLWVSIVWTIALFWRLSKTAAWLLVPYLLWVSFAACLALSIWTLN